MSCNLSLYRLNAALAYNHKLPKFISAQLNRDCFFTFEVHISLGAQIPKTLKLSFRRHNNPLHWTREAGVGSTGHNHFGTLLSRPSDHGDRQPRLRAGRPKVMPWGRQPVRYAGVIPLFFLIRHLYLIGVVR